jgi:hypothetical protein
MSSARSKAPKARYSSPAHATEVTRLSSSAALLLLAAFPVPLAAQRDGGTTRPRAAFRFSYEAGTALGALWKASLAAREERVACLASTIRNDTVFVSRIDPVEPEEADSMGISATASIERCGPPEWSGTVHTHIALYTDDSPSTRFSAQDRTAMRLWYDRWHADGVFCLIYSGRDAHCEADGVVGGMRVKPRMSR